MFSFGTLPTDRDALAPISYTVTTTGALVLDQGEGQEIASVILSPAQLRSLRPVLDRMEVTTRC